MTALARDMGLEIFSLTDRGGVIYRDPPGGGASVRYYRVDTATGRFREVTFAAGAGLNAGDWAWAAGNRPTPGVESLDYSDGTVPGGNTVVNTALLTPFASTYTIAANRLRVGSTIRLTLRGTFGTAVVAPALTLAVFGNAVVMATTGPFVMPAAIAAGFGWTAELDCVVATLGVGGTIECQGRVGYFTAAGVELPVAWNNIIPIVIDTTIPQVLTAQVLWGFAAPANTITLRTMLGETLNTPV